MTESTQRYRIVGASFALFVVFALASTALAETRDTEKRSQYSAIASLQRAATLLDCHLDVVELLRQFDVPAHAEDADLRDTIATTATTAGLYAKSYDGLRLQQFRSVSGIFILRIRPALDAPHYDHYLTLEAIHEREAVLYDGRFERIQIPLADLLTLWDGSGVLISDKPIHDQGLAQSELHKALVYIIVTVVACAAFGLSLVVPRGRISKSFRPKHITQGFALILLLSALLGGGTYIVMDDTGLVGPSVGEPHSSSILIDFRDEVEPVSAINVVDLGAGKLRELLKAESVVFVDARSMEEFELAHIKDAIHLARFDSSSIRLGLAGIAKDQAIIVYCSSINCPRGRAATGALMKAGFTHVTHYPPGWSELKSWEELSIYKHLGEQSH